jgi:hypothetical protein
MAKRLRAADYKKEYQDLKDSLAAMEKRIEQRFQTLCEQHPDAPLYKTSGFPGEDVPAGAFIADNPHPIARLDTEARIRCIDKIEEYIASKNPHKQTTIEFTDFV